MDYSDPGKDVPMLIALLYDSISGPAGERDWSVQHEIYHPEARLMRTEFGSDGRPTIRVMNQQEYRENTSGFFRSTGFFEKETARSSARFGHIQHVWSSYEARISPDAEPFKRGLNSIQLFHDGSRWWVVSILWDNERPGNPLPESGLPDYG